MSYPYTPAFVAFCGGAPLEEIAHEFNIPIESLKAKIRQDAWRSLANRISGRIAVEVTSHDEALNKIETNRAKNYETAAKLRDHAIEIIHCLRAGTLRIKKRFQQKGQLVEQEVEPGPADWLSIATYLRTVTDMTYRALGDFQAQGGKAVQDAPAGTPSPPAPPITIVLPSAVARPRQERGLTIEVGDTATPPLLPAATEG